MPQVVIQPALSDRASQENWERTLDSEIEFTLPQYSQVLSAAETAQLISFHPAGRARFWGSSFKQDRNYAKLGPGDVVLLTGRNHVQAVGEIGAILKNSAFGDLLWRPDPENGSWLNIYSLQGFEKTQIPYEEIRALPGFSSRYPFRSMHVLEPGLGNVVLEGLRIQAAGGEAGPDPEEAKRLAALAERTGHVIAAENFSTDRTSYQRPGGTVHVNRAESLLITAYRASQPGDQGTTLRTPTGLADYYAEGPDGNLLVEAKSSARHPYVRQALSQLLDYSRFTRKPVRLAALFPRRPEPPGLELLHCYGIDCIYLDDDGAFATLAAPSST